MIQKEFIPYEEALALKELGFDDPCFTHYLNSVLLKNSLVVNKREINSCFDQIRVAAPLYQQTFRWFREKYEYEISIHKLIEEDGYMASIGWEGVKDIMEQVEGTTYEEAELFCLQQMIILCKQN